MNNMEKREYTGLVTSRMTVETPNIMGTSTAKVKVKTDTSTSEWVQEEVATPLSTTISSTIE